MLNKQVTRVDRGLCLLLRVKKKTVLQNKIREREPRLKRANAAMASSSAMTPFNSLPDEVALKIVKLAATYE